MEKKSIEIVEVKNVDNISLVFLEAVLMPNGEVLCNGLSLGFREKFGKIFIKKIYD